MKAVLVLVLVLREEELVMFAMRQVIGLATVQSRRKRAAIIAVVRTTWHEIARRVHPKVAAVEEEEEEGRIVSSVVVQNTSRGTVQTTTSE